MIRPLLFLVFITTQLNAMNFDASSIQVMLINISTNNDDVKQSLSQKQIEDIALLPEEIHDLASFQAYAAHYAWASSEQIIANASGVNTLIDPCLRLENMDPNDPFLQRMQEIFKQYPTEKSASVVTQNNNYFYFYYHPNNNKKLQWSKKYFKNHLIKNHEDLMPNYKNILQQIKTMTDDYTEQSSNFISKMKTLSEAETAEFLKLNSLDKGSKDQFIEKISAINADLVRIGNNLKFVNSPHNTIQIMDLYLLAEQSFYNLKVIENVTKDMIEHGHFFPKSNYSKQNPPLKDFKKFLSHRQVPLRSLYLVSRAVAFSLLDFANKLRAKASLEPIPEDIFEQSQIVKDALEIDESLIDIDDFIRLKKPVKSVKSIKTINLSQEEHSNWTKDTPAYLFIQKKSQNKANNNQKTPKIDHHKSILKNTQAENVSIKDEEISKASIGLRVYRLLDQENQEILDDLFKFIPNKLHHHRLNKLTIAVYKALIDLNKASRAAEFIKKSSDSRIFTKGKEEQLLSTSSLEHRLLPYLLQDIIPPNHDKDILLKASPFLYERVSLEKIMLYNDEIDTNMLYQLEQFLLASEEASIIAGPTQKRILLVNLAHAWHKLDIAVERAKSIGYKALSLETHRKKIIALLNQALEIIKGKNSQPASILEAYLYNYYLKIELTPKYNHLTDEEINNIKQRAAANLLKKEHKYTVVIDKVSPSGKKIGEHKIHDSIFHAITNNELGDYLIVSFNKPVKERKIPLFIHYNDKIYRTDVFGGSLLKPDTTKDDYGSLIAVSLQASDFFKSWFSSNESFWYGQRAFLPAEANLNTKSIHGQLKVATIPDHEQLTVIDNLIVQDGFGYIKETVANDLKLEEVNRYPRPYQKKVAYQAFQAYDADHKAAALELFRGSQQSLAEIDFYNAHASDLANALMTTVPKLTNIGLPVRANKIVLPDNSYWQDFAKEGLLLGRNPYSAQRIQVVNPKNISKSKTLVKLPVFQYTMTGYYSENGQQVGSFFKGLLAVIPDHQWPTNYKNVHILLSSKDQKLNQNWLSKNIKDNDQNKQQILHLNAVLLVKQEYHKKHLVGLPINIAEYLAGDYDGDPYDLMPCKNYQYLSKMILDLSTQSIPNPKINKSFTKRESPGNFNRILDLRKPILSIWNVIFNRFYYLLKDERTQFVKDITKNHMLQQWLGDNWHNKLGVEKVSESDIAIAEMQLGIKYGEDAYKTNVDIESVLNRAREYEKALNKIRPNQEIPYGKGLIKKLNNSRDLKMITAPALTNKKSANLPDKAFRAQARFLADKHDYEDWLSDDE